MSKRGSGDTVPKQVADYVSVLNDLHEKWMPHPGQLEPGTHIFYKDCKQMFIAFGRRAGKTEFAMYCLVRWALTHPNSECYLIGPMQRQMRGIVFSNNRLMHFIPKKYVARVNETEMRISLTNGSIIKVDGSDNIDTLRGLRMNFLVIDEYKDCRADLLETVRPSLADFQAPLLVLGTPPTIENHYVDLMREAQVSPDWRFYKLPTSCNPYISKEWLEKEKARLVRNGDTEIWHREYEAEFVKGGKKSIFPMLSDSHIVDHLDLLKSLDRKFDQYDWVCSMDPGSASVFAVLFVGVNHYTGDVVVLDELYLDDQKDTRIGVVWPKCAEQMAQVPNTWVEQKDWYVVVDEAALWARNELLDRFGVNSFPTHKSKNKKEDGLSLIKDLLSTRKIRFSSKCVKLRWEMENYTINDAGKLRKEHDHLIDAIRYALAGAHYSTVPEPMPMIREPDPLEEGRMVSIEQDFFSSRETDYMLDD